MNPDKPVEADNVPTPTERLRRQFSHEEIAQRAEQLWTERGQPSGQDDAIWLEAESLLKGEADQRPVAGTESRPYVNEPAKQPAKPSTKSRDPAETGVQTRSATDAKSKQTAGRIRNQ